MQEKMGIKKCLITLNFHHYQGNNYKQMTMLRQILISNLTIILLFCGCAEQSREDEFLAKYEFEDFNQFKGTNIFVRNFDKQGNLIIIGYAPDLKNDSTKTGYFYMKLDAKNHQAIKTTWTLTEDYADADTVKLQQLAQAFIKYDIPRLKVVKNGNVFVYKNLEKLAFVRFVDDNELLKSSHRKWSNITGNWYKPK